MKEQLSSDCTRRPSKARMRLSLGGGPPLAGLWEFECKTATFRLVGFDPKGAQDPDVFTFHDLYRRSVETAYAPPLILNVLDRELKRIQRAFYLRQPHYRFEKPTENEQGWCWSVRGGVGWYDAVNFPDHGVGWQTFPIETPTRLFTWKTPAVRLSRAQNCRHVLDVFQIIPELGAHAWLPLAERVVATTENSVTLDLPVTPTANPTFVRVFYAYVPQDTPPDDRGPSLWCEPVFAGARALAGQESDALPR